MKLSILVISLAGDYLYKKEFSDFNGQIPNVGDSIVWGEKGDRNNVSEITSVEWDLEENSVDIICSKG